MESSAAKTAMLIAKMDSAVRGGEDAARPLIPRLILLQSEGFRTGLMSP